MDIDGEVQSASIPEHNYSKAAGEESMDANAGNRMSKGGSPLVTTLDEQADTFESFLLCLLRAFTKQQHLVITCGEPAAQETETVEITPEALSTLSSDQVTTLVTSNSVNFDVVQQILTQKQRHHSSKSELAPSEARSMELPTALGVVTGGGADLAGVGADITPAFQISPDQLKQLQLHVSELIRSQQISLPPDLTPEQQQQLIRTILLQQLQAAPGVSKETNEGDKGNGIGDRASKGNEAEGAHSKGKDTEVKSDPTPVAAESPSQIYPQTSISGEVSPPVDAVASAVQTTTPSPVVVPPQLTTSTAPSIQVATSQATSEAQLPSGKTSTSPAAGTKKRRDNTKGKKGDEIKKPSMPYNLFFSEVYSTVLAANPKMTFSDCSRIISMMWNAMGADSKKRYYDEHNRQKEEYKAAMDRRAVEHAMQASSVSPTSPGLGDSGLGQLGSEKTEAMEVAVPALPETKPKDPSLCINAGCVNLAVFTEDRGKDYCSNACAVDHCKSIFNSWVGQHRKAKAS